VIDQCQIFPDDLPTQTMVTARPTSLLKGLLQPLLPVLGWPPVGDIQECAKMHLLPHARTDCVPQSPEVSGILHIRLHHDTLPPRFKNIIHPMTDSLLPHGTIAPLIAANTSSLSREI